MVKCFSPLNSLRARNNVRTCFCCDLCSLESIAHVAQLQSRLVFRADAACWECWNGPHHLKGFSAQSGVHALPEPTVALFTGVRGFLCLGEWLYFTRAGLLAPRTNPTTPPPLYSQICSINNGKNIFATKAMVSNTLARVRK